MLRKIIPGMMIVLFTLAAGTALAGPSPAPDKAADVAIIGDRLVDIAYNLGVVPAAMSVRASFWPMFKTLNTAAEFPGCPNCLTKKKCRPLIEFAGNNGINRVIIEKGSPFCIYKPDLKPENLAGLLEDAGLAVDIVEYTGDLEAAVRQMAQLLGKEAQADALLATYAARMQATTQSLAGKTFARNVVIINGVYQQSSGKTFLRVEAPGGYADQYLLGKLGCKNTGHLMAGSGAKVSKGYITVRKLDGLAEAMPDAIIITGDAPSVQKAIYAAVKANPALANVPAVKNHAVFSLPGFINASIIEYPMILGRWGNILNL